MAAISLATLGFSAIQTLTFSISVQCSKVVLFGGKGKPVAKFIAKAHFRNKVKDKNHHCPGIN
jgi:hypothetical protein